MSPSGDSTPPELDNESSPTTDAPVRLNEAPTGTIAVVRGEAVTELPTDLYIPPDALEVFLETFEGPLDLLLYLIRRENLDILNIRVAEITAQYLRYIDLMHALQLELAGEYLLMAAMLAEIKSRMLLPKPVNEEGEEEDPRAELIRRLQEYEQLKAAAENLDELPRMERDLHPAQAAKPKLVREQADPQVALKDLLFSLARVLERADQYAHHAVMLEPLSVRERMTQVLGRISTTSTFIEFQDLFTVEEGRRGVIVTFLAVMEMVRESLVDLVQREAFGPIYVRAAEAQLSPVETELAGDGNDDEDGESAFAEDDEDDQPTEADGT
ncbi:MAG: ScpA family protein [Pseudomonadota bacterium]